MGLLSRIQQKRNKKILNQTKYDLEKAEDINGMFKAVKPLFEKDILNEDNMFDKDLEHLTKDGELPFGWFSSHPDVEKWDNGLAPLINRYNNLLKSDGFVDEKIESIKTVITYLEEYKKYCYSKNECYIFYYAKQYEHCHNSWKTDFALISNYQEWLKELEDNYDSYKLRETLIKTLPDDLYLFLKGNNGILQKNIYKSFDTVIKNDIQNLLYQWQKEGKINREKQGNSYIINIK